MSVVLRNAFTSDPRTGGDVLREDHYCRCRVFVSDKGPSRAPDAGATWSRADASFCGGETGVGGG